MKELIDVHAHINSVFYADNYEEVLKQALKKVAVINVGTDLKDSEENVKIAEKFEGVWAIVGQHPTTETKEFNYEAFKKLAENEKVVAIGECGLDFFRIKEGDKKNRAEQEEVFKAQIKLAREVKKPLMLHVRTEESWNKVLEILETESDLPEFICHFFSGDIKQTRQILELGGYFTFGGVITFSRDYDEIVKEIPLEAIMLETDSPFVTPEPYRGQQNRPEYVIETGKKLAEIKGISYKEVVEITTKTAKKLFKIYF